jgi:alkanesulfonate monooxygenase SsuD/methylene tetrahydromethanopterin reductase-like flavin-dependent oxidoreductase (luciferase family)
VPSFGLQMPSFTFDDVPNERMFERIADTAIAAEEAGFDSFWVMDHYTRSRASVRNCRDIGRDRSEIITTRLGTPITDPTIVETSRAFFEVGLDGMI